MKRVTVAVLAYNEEANLPDLLGSLAAQTLPQDQFDILIVDNGSSDRTREIAEQWQSPLNNLRVVVQPVPGIAVSRNCALAEATTALIAFTDADVICPPGWLQTLVEGFDRHHARDEHVVAVGGGNTPVSGQGAFLTAIGITLNSFWGSHGSVQGMIYTDDRDVEHIPTLNICYDRERVRAAGGFDEDFRMVSEDPELNHRLTRRHGYKIVFLAGAEVEHKMRPDLKSWWRNVYMYGRGRTQIIKKHPDHLQWKYMVPPVLLAVLALIPLGLVHPLFWLPAVYWIAPLPIAAYLCLRAGKPTLTPLAYLILVGNPVFYGLGMIHGLWFRYEPVSPRCVDP
ncbi:MAG: glycosyltransferase [Candidatus Lernaella stagnicola]|nr:glycosyltransferase [Candidatus Lernaella stagnicola]